MLEVAAGKRGEEKWGEERVHRGFVETDLKE